MVYCIGHHIIENTVLVEDLELILLHDKKHVVLQPTCGDGLHHKTIGKMSHTRSPKYIYAYKLLSDFFLFLFKISRSHT